MKRRLVVCGEESRGDDAVAFAALELLSGRLAEDVVVRRTRAPAPDDFIDIEEGDVCVVADAVSGVTPGEILTVPLSRIREGGGVVTVSTHTIPLRDSLRIAERVLGFTPGGTFVGMGGRDFGLGSELSEGVEGNIELFSAAILRALQSGIAEGI